MKAAYLFQSTSSVKCSFDLFWSEDAQTQTNSAAFSSCFSNLKFKSPQLCLRVKRTSKESHLKLSIWQTVISVFTNKVLCSTCSTCSTSNPNDGDRQGAIDYLPWHSHSLDGNSWLQAGLQPKRQLSIPYSLFLEEHLCWDVHNLGILRTNAIFWVQRWCYWHPNGVLLSDLAWNHRW